MEASQFSSSKTVPGGGNPKPVRVGLPSDELSPVKTLHQGCFETHRISVERHDPRVYGRPQLGQCTDFRTILQNYYEIRARAIQRRADEVGQAPQAPSPLVANQSWLATKRQLGNFESLDFLEVGPGDGNLAHLAFRDGAASVSIVDISQERLDTVARSLHPECTLQSFLGDVCDGIPLANHSVDFVAAQEVIEHLSDPVRFVSECFRVLRPGGRLYLSTPNHWALDLVLRNLGRVLDPRPPIHGEALVHKTFSGLLPYLEPSEADWLALHLPAGFREHLQEYSPWGLRALLKKAGFASLRAWGTRPRVAKTWKVPWPEGSPWTYLLADNLRIIGTKL